MIPIQEPDGPSGSCIGIIGMVHK